MVKLLTGDCLKMMMKMESESIDAVVCDPPYGISYMKQHWDYDVPPIEVWQECLRLLKQGGHLVSFSSPRTYHRIASIIEDAGFEVRDQLQWIYSPGLAKSQNIAKDLDKMRATDEEVRKVSRWMRERCHSCGLTAADLNRPRHKGDGSPLDLRR